MNVVTFAAVRAALSLGAFAATPVLAAEYTAVTPPDVKWTDAPSIGPGVKTAVVDGDPK